MTVVASGVTLVALACHSVILCGIERLCALFGESGVIISEPRAAVLRAGQLLGEGAKSALVFEQSLGGAIESAHFTSMAFAAGGARDFGRIGKRLRIAVVIIQPHNLTCISLLQSGMLRLWEHGVKSWAFWLQRRDADTVPLHGLPFVCPADSHKKRFKYALMGGFLVHSGVIPQVTIHAGRDASHIHFCVHSLWVDI